MGYGVGRTSIAKLADAGEKIPDENGSRRPPASRIVHQAHRKTNPRADAGRSRMPNS